MEDWMAQCKALVPNEQVWLLLEEWPWAEAYVSEFSPVQAVGGALLDVLAPEVGAAFPAWVVQ